MTRHYQVHASGNGQYSDATETQKREAIRLLRRELRALGSGSAGSVTMVQSQKPTPDHPQEHYQQTLIYQCHNEDGQLVVEEL